MNVGDIPDVQLDDGGLSPTELHALMPYILDPMAAATRRDVMKDNSTAEERRARKATGVYYTPGDVAHLMVDRVLKAGNPSDDQTWFDPAHGSGVFLRAVLDATKAVSGSAERIYGVDLDPIAAETSSFVLVAEHLRIQPVGDRPWQRWHKFRRNLATGNSLLIETRASTMAPLPLFLDEDSQGTNTPLGTSGPWRVQEAFPEIDISGFDRIVANPPYAPLTQTMSTHSIPSIHPVTGPTASQDISPIFVELCTNLLCEDGAMAIVLPLSIVSSTRAPFPDLRLYLAAQPGWLELLAFDRVPDALFGDDIKTRNAIVHLDKTAPQSITASPLYRWTSRTRKMALSEIPAVDISDLAGVPNAIPKISSEWERQLLVACGAHPHHLEEWQRHRHQSTLLELDEEIADNIIALAPTAYNFLSVMRDPQQAIRDGHNSQNSFSVLRFSSSMHASAAYAMLNSRLAFWLWHVTGDGFHVTNTIHSRLPTAEIGDSAVHALAKLGEVLWRQSSSAPAVSTNRGRITITYPAWRQYDIIEQIDHIMGSIIENDYASPLSVWHENLIVVDAASDRRILARKK